MTVVLEEDETIQYKLWSSISGYGIARIYYNGQPIDSLDYLNSEGKFGSFFGFKNGIVVIEAISYGSGSLFGAKFTHSVNKIQSFTLLDNDKSNDIYGNLINSINAHDDTVSTKYSDDGLLLVVSAQNCFSNELLYLDFEQSSSWDGWDYNYNPSWMSITSHSFTGNNAFWMKVYDTEIGYNYGPYRIIDADSLADSLYNISAWVKTNSIARIYIYCRNSLGEAPDSAIKILSYHDETDCTTDSVDNFEWHKIDTIININDLPTGHILDNIKIQLAVFKDDCPSGILNFAIFDDIRFHPADAQVSTCVYDPVTYLTTSESGANNIPVRYYYDDFGRLVSKRNYKSEILSNMEYYYSLEESANFDTTNPNYVKTTSYFNEYDSVTSISYYDGLGQLLQTRSTNYVDDNEASLVTGIAEYDARGRVTKTYKPYYDLDDSAGVDNYSVWDSVSREINAYYDGSNAPNCNGIPYSKNIYWDDYNGNIKSKLGPGSVYSLEANGIKYISAVNPDSICILSYVFDQDDNRTISRIDKWGLTTVDTTYYTNSEDQSDKMITLTYKNIKGQVDSVGIVETSQSNTRRILRRYWYDDLGQEIRNWKIDYGYIRMIYDDYGNLRFMMNDKRKEQGNVTYFKYDTYGRKIEEGVVDTLIIDTVLSEIISTNIMTQQYANIPTFPEDTLSDSFLTIKYRWYYDYLYGSNIPVNYGSVVRVENNDSLEYFREYYSLPFDLKDSTVVKLMIEDGDKKSIVNRYDYGGQLLEKTMFRFEDSTDARSYKYIYDKAGRLNRIRENKLGLFAIRDTLDNTIYDYYADGNVKEAIYGRYYPALLFNPKDTAAVNHYKYDARGALIGINDLDMVQDDISLQYREGYDSCHFAMDIDYLGSYKNGLISGITTKNSATSGTITHDYEYGYNELGWLTNAQHQINSNYDRSYDYNYLGNRTQITKGINSIQYYFNTDSAQSSLLDSVSGYYMNTPRSYDILGNLYTDIQNGMDSSYYDYRNLLSWTSVQPTELYVDTSSIMTFYYDENGQRIKKQIYFWYFSDTTGGGGIIFPDPGTEPPGIILNGVQPDGAQLRGYSETHYLYDNDGTLLAIFNEADSAKQVYVNGLMGQEAVYQNNDNDFLHYLLKDHLGSVRVVVDDLGFGEEYTNYYPYGNYIEHWANYNDPMKFTGKERDQHASFDYYYYGARYYNPELGMFSSVDKAGQTAGGYLYCGNNPIMMIDPDGNLFGIDDLLVGIIIGAVIGGYSGYQYADANGLNPFLYMLGGAVIGGVSGYYGATIGSGSAIGGLAISSGVNSAGWTMMTGGKSDFTINFGIGSVNLSNDDNWNWDWADFSGDWDEDISDAMGWSAALDDLSKIEYNLFENAETKAYDKKIQDIIDNNEPIESKGKWDYYDITDAGEPSNPSYSKIQEWIKERGGDPGKHFRTRKYHVVKSGNKYIVHVNRFPSTALGGLMNIPHIALEGSIYDINKGLGFSLIPKFIGDPINYIRWRITDISQYNYMVYYEQRY